MRISRDWARITDGKNGNAVADLPVREALKLLAERSNSFTITVHEELIVSPPVKMEVAEPESIEYQKHEPQVHAELPQRTGPVANLRALITYSANRSSDDLATALDPSSGITPAEMEELVAYLSDVAAELTRRVAS